MTILLYLLIGVLVTSCNVGPDYQPPNTIFSEHWNNVSSITEKSLDHKWWHCFDDPVLLQLIDKAYEQNIDIKLAIQRLIQSRANIDVAVSDLLPQLGVSSKVERERNTAPGFPLNTPFSASQIHFDMAWEIDLFGKNRRKLEAETAISEMTAANLKSVQVSIVAEVARNYIDYRLNEKLLQITEENIKTQEKTAYLINKQLVSGQAAQFDSLRADSQLNTTRAKRPKYVAMMVASQYNLESLLGMQPSSLTNILNQRTGIPVVPIKFEIQAPVRVIHQRPDIQAAERQLAAATALEGVAIAQMYPNLSLKGFFGALSPTTIGTGLFSQNNRSWYEAGTISIPLFNFGKLQSFSKIAHSESQQAIYNYQQIILKALVEVETALKDFEQEHQRIIVLTKATRDIEKAVEIAHKRYSQGLTSLLELLDAQRTLYNLQEQLASVEASLAENLVRLNKAVGGGWKIYPTDSECLDQDQQNAD